MSKQYRPESSFLQCFLTILYLLWKKKIRACLTVKLAELQNFRRSFRISNFPKKTLKHLCLFPKFATSFFIS